LLPRYGIAPGVSPLELDVLFGRRAPRIVEVGFGNGAALLAMAAARPDADFLGIEVHGPGVGALLLRLEDAGLDNVRVAREDAASVFAVRLPAGSVDAVHVFFPDPWPKKRHHKRRLIQPAFLAHVARVLREGGRLHVATDWEDYAIHILDAAAAVPQLRNLGGSDGFSPRPDYRPPTKYEQRGQRLGHEVRDMIFEKRGKSVGNG
jgi:tRNA (guanine-N7-)-methyltransferase